MSAPVPIRTNGRAKRLDDALPPHSLEAERKALGCCLMDARYLLAGELEESDFYVETHRTIWRAMLWLHAEGMPVDTTHVLQRLESLGKLLSVGGYEFVASLTDTIPAPETFPAVLLRKLRRQREGLAAVQRAELAIAKGELSEARDALAAGVELLSDPKPQPTAFDGLWRTVGDWGALTEPPPARRWLLDRPDDETNGTTNPVGLLPLGKTGFLISPGGVGKTLALIQLAIAVATGRRWLEHYGTPNPGNVLLLLAEEDEEELRRRFHETARAMRLTPDQVALAAERIIALPLAGRHVALLASDGANTAGTAILAELLHRLDEREWRLIILDPLSRFAGAETEKDNAEATRFVQVAESLSDVRGRPTVLIAHHTNKLSRVADATASANDARGPTGLTDGTRWVANLERKGDGAKLSFTKNNYAAEAPSVTLVRDRDHGGHLRVATSEEARREAERREAEADAQRALKLDVRDTQVRSAIVDALRAHGPMRSKQALIDATHKGRSDVFRALAQLEQSGQVVHGPAGYQLPPGGQQEAAQ